jgi:hypothetical protein
LKPAPPPAGSRYQSWKFQLSPAAITADGSVGLLRGGFQFQHLGFKVHRERISGRILSREGQAEQSQNQAGKG